MFPELNTKRLRLREIHEHDAEALFQILSTDEVIRFYGQDALLDVQQAKDIVASFAKNYLENRVIRWGIERKDTKELIGTIGFHAYSPNYRRAEIGYVIHPAHWRIGFASEALKEIIAYGFNNLQLTRIGAVVFLENQPSSNLLIKHGFIQEGILRSYIYQYGIPHDTYMYSLLKS
ncbi:GNAT family N-acetyltransferase [Peribacillus muralis]|uniref:GNAT family N-acetyltransferase n=1 Tax=Peribacillus muralis TaxID=264697 RepID=UPI001F4EA385|nr:GNAT family N-acetyltransferase [Peribacillus muralis]MCK1995200.1 GNAT family N-acetyltransferase [Peribacillus muralis]MCK2015717.1 GNAT family N-acetyltransferase [Peribacillus muralis]